MNEVKEAIQQLKNNKATGKDGLGIVFKFGPEKLAECMHRIIERIWDSEQLSEEWKERVITPVYNKGDKLDCENYRVITVSNTAYKVLSQVLSQALITTAKWICWKLSSRIHQRQINKRPNLYYTANPPKMP